MTDYAAHVQRLRKCSLYVIIMLSGEGGVDPGQVPEWLERGGKGEDLEVFQVIRRWDCVEASCWLRLVGPKTA